MTSISPAFSTKNGTVGLAAVDQHFARVIGRITPSEAIRAICAGLTRKQERLHSGRLREALSVRTQSLVTRLDNECERNVDAHNFAIGSPMKRF